MQLKRHASEILHKLGLNVSLRQRVSCLGVGGRQLVEIAKALSMEFRIMLGRVQSLAANYDHC
jgi:ABC-type sugar transport system ATPase subunit